MWWQLVADALKSWGSAPADFSRPLSAHYTYLDNSALVGQISFKQGANVRMTTGKQFDALNRLTQISSVPSASSAVSFTYSYNDSNQRTAVRLNDGNYWRFGYDSLGQVTSGHKYFSDQAPVAGQQFDYAFDTTGNRTQTKAGGDATGANQRVANYYANLLNQYTNRDVPGAVDVMGISIATNAVTVNGQTAQRGIFPPTVQCEQLDRGGLDKYHGVGDGPEFAVGKSVCAENAGAVRV